jgi:hypothetical protein
LKKKGIARNGHGKNHPAFDLPGWWSRGFYGQYKVNVAGYQPAQFWIKPKDKLEVVVHLQR